MGIFLENDEKVTSIFYKIDGPSKGADHGRQHGRQLARDATRCVASPVAGLDISSECVA